MNFSSQAIAALQKAFPINQTFLRGSLEFDELNRSYLSAIESDVTPAAIFRPKDKHEVFKFIQITQPYTCNGDAKFAIRGGGQQPTHACANIQDGITLDLGMLTGIEVKDDSVSIAAGERWGAVYERLLPLGLATSGSRSGKGGIGGLSLSGGLSFFSTREGFIADNVINYEVVLASGDIVNANEHENTDLLVALRGGGNNFGVVTRYDVRTFKQGPFWGGSVYYFTPSFPSQLEALVAELKNPNATAETHLMLSIGYAAQFGQTMCQNQLYYTQETERNPEVLEPFTNIQPQVDALYSMRKLKLVEAATEQTGDAMDRRRADVDALKAAADIYTAALDPIKTVEGLVCSLTLQPYPVSLLKKTAEAGGNSLGLDPAHGPLVSVLLITYWKHENDDEKVFQVMQSTLEKIKYDARSRNKTINYEFMNYAAAFQDPIDSYGAENKKKLQDVSKKYDPEGLFQKAVPGGFKLFT
ncbi:FAD-binding domain-containing protein [Aaosphaeria arxii CBS 175.79]|uniref:FAD-binding domain-containing protein n=1 Tax=Aaosphaeria arxii CBS 175.79 TaxID=1450172 RepID=A0A6A5XDP7_9PLEO|nr:FAD-binding domain-containing protein [Aaosphaeria arxii CBS 175.79]KAF2010894.1 FAD-binding domain-containing protein [Aaosphaeria arxii CBS 175.79]